MSVFQFNIELHLQWDIIIWYELSTSKVKYLLGIGINKISSQQLAIYSKF